jgi:trehalose-phosphatase
MTRVLRFNDIHDSIAHARRVFVVSDFDGTLCPIASSPDRVQVSARTRRVLQDLGACNNVTLAIISGRALVDVRAHAGIDAIYGGNHGIEICGPGIDFVHPDAAAFSMRMNRLCSELESVIRPWPGAWVENKVWTSTVHMRAVPVENWPPLVSAIRTCLASEEDLFGFRTGRSALEIYPRIGWDKGSAVKYLIRTLGIEDALTICFGDDTTDESMFAAVSNGISVRVGPAAQTCAAFCLPSVDDVTNVLEETVHLLQTIHNPSAVWRLPRGGQCRGGQALSPYAHRSKAAVE